MPELSIIVPVYKVEKYLPKCIDSILAQTFTDFELILIDDGSPDRCGEICDEYAVLDSRIKVIHQNNQGVSAARNAGLDIAAGTYLGFVDSDDWIEPEMYERMLQCIIQNNCDVAICGFKSINIDESNNYKLCSKEHDLQEQSGQLIDWHTLMLLTFGITNKVFYGVLWNKLFRRNVINDIRLNEKLSLFEDWLGLINIYQNCDKAYVLSETYYKYTTNGKSSLSNTLDEKEIYASMSEFYTILGKYRNTDSCIYSCIIERFLDDGANYLNRIHMLHKHSWISLKLKMRMMKIIGVAYREKLLPKTTIHKYLYMIIKL